MLRWIVLLAVLLPLAGCESDEDFWQPYDDAVASVSADDTPAMAATPVRQTGNAHCQEVAQQRAADAKANGVDRDTRAAIYADTYSSCTAWDSTHPELWH